jgi:hypothetical protein
MGLRTSVSTLSRYFPAPSALFSTVVAGKGPDDLVFTSARGRPLSRPDRGVEATGTGGPTPSTERRRIAREAACPRTPPPG